MKIAKHRIVFLCNKKELINITRRWADLIQCTEHLRSFVLRGFELVGVQKGTACRQKKKGLNLLTSHLIWRLFWVTRG